MTDLPATEYTVEFAHFQKYADEINRLEGVYIKDIGRWSGRGKRNTYARDECEAFVFRIMRDESPTSDVKDMIEKIRLVLDSVQPYRAGFPYIYYDGAAQSPDGPKWLNASEIAKVHFITPFAINSMVNYGGLQNGTVDFYLEAIRPIGLFYREAMFLVEFADRNMPGYQEFFDRLCRDSGIWQKKGPRLQAGDMNIYMALNKGYPYYAVKRLIKNFGEEGMAKQIHFPIVKSLKSKLRGTKFKSDVKIFTQQ